MVFKKECNDKVKELTEKYEEIYSCWQPYKLSKIMDTLEEVEINFSLSEEGSMSTEEYKLFSSAYTLCKKKLFNTCGVYFEQMGQISLAAIAGIQDETNFLNFLEEFKQRFQPDVTNPQMLKNYQDSLLALENHFNLRIRNKV